MKVLVFNQQQDLDLSIESVRPVVKSVLALEKVRCDEVAVYFVTQQKISKLHETFFDDPSPTDCIAFPMDAEEEGGYRILGEVFICPKTARDYLLTSGEGVLKDPYHETTLYLVHTLLHLLGYDDKEIKAIKQMRAAEKRHMLQLIASKSLLHK